MPLAQEDFESITRHIKEKLPAWLAEQRWDQSRHVYEIELRERIVRVEEELKNQRELMKQGFELMEKRFEQMEQGFEQLTKRMDRFMIWSFGLTVSMVGIVIAVLKYTGSYPIRA